MEYLRPQVIGETQGWRATADAKRANQAIDEKLRKQRSRWKLKPPANMTVMLHKNAGIVLSVPHEVGRWLLHKRMAAILEHDVTIDAVIDGGLE